MIATSHDPHPNAEGCSICGASAEPPVVAEKDGYSITKCGTCGVGRTVVTAFAPEDFYTEAYFNGGVEGAYRDYEGSQATLQREFRGQVQFLKAALPNGGKLLEVGCAYGFFLQEARSHFDVYGFEMAQSGVDFCRRQGLPNVYQGEVDEERLRRFGPFDAVVLLDVIEHIDRVSDTMRTLVRHMKPNAVLLITTGDWSSIPAKWLGSRWRLLTPPLHLWFFTPRSLRYLLEGLGCRLVGVSHPWKLVPLELILSQAWSMIGLKWTLRLARHVRNIGVPANMFDSMRLVFRKV